jgi:hypothetical protein
VTPDANRDVVVHAFTLVDALTGEAVGDRWSVWIGRDREGSFDNEGDALARARAIADERGVPAWLVRAGGAASPITRSS